MRRRAREALHQRRKKLLRGGVDPVEVFHGEDEGVPVTGTQDYLP